MGLKEDDARLLRAARRFVDVHLGDRQLVLQQVATHVHLSPRQLQRLYAAAGTSYSADLLARRMTRARELLRGGDSARLVAINVGYGSGSALAKAFCRHFGYGLEGARPDQDVTNPKQKLAIESR